MGEAMTDTSSLIGAVARYYALGVMYHDEAMALLKLLGMSDHDASALLGRKLKEAGES
jgi:hypothetical protein